MPPPDGATFRNELVFSSNFSGRDGDFDEGAPPPLFFPLLLLALVPPSFSLTTATATVVDVLSFSRPLPSFSCTAFNVFSAGIGCGKTYL